MNLAELKQMPWAEALKYLKNSFDLCDDSIKLLAVFDSADDFLKQANNKEKSEMALRWAAHCFEDKDVVRHFIKTSREALLWTMLFPGDRELMFPLVTTSEDVCQWVLRFPEDRKSMRSLVTRPIDARCWALRFPKDREYFVQKGLL